ncbi:penicillin-binding protein 1C [Thiothrix eikelboomii]|uniref:peptidoglycan glycosyltransferase n=1 Tax=Thiothrix eikelboomii TaxID=92487 RepID=A0A1T4XEK7_9GAMM|nr:penicillin-binding protein 1C [Thiothrix eikelboomii]SKA87899.1 penicillin-binding protein 1C [Thiothrix eikelboomii]
MAQLPRLPLLPLSLARVQGRTLAKFCFSLLFLGGLLVGGWWWYFDSLPRPLFAKTHAQILLDRQGRLLSAHIADDGQWRFPAIEKVPDKFTIALTQFEDRRFQNHSGVDFLALIRATYDNLRQQRIVSGASTLSMQVIRLARGNPPRTLPEKIVEMFRAWRLESLYSKPEILQLYASHAPFGGNVVGLEAAAWRYFARDPEQLSWAEHALLAVLPNNPALIHPGRNRTQLLQKRNRLLARLYTVQVLSKLDYELAMAEPLPEAPHLLPRLAPHLLDTLAASYPQGERFQTTIDANLQQQLVTLAQRTGDQLALEGIQNLAILVLDNHSLATLAYIGNRPDRDYRAELGHAIDLIQRPRSSGSTLKPLLFADMLEQGMLLPDSLIADVPVNYTGFTPQNFNRQYHGAVSAREALARSLNIPFVNLLSLRGVDPFLMYLRQMGFQHLQRSARHYGLSLVLGGAETSLWELTVAYANLAHLAQTSTIKQAYWQQGRRLQTEIADSGRIATLSKATAWLTLDSLLDLARPGDEGYWDKFSSSRKVAWKTGTSYGQRDAWAIGTTPDYTVGVWVGNANGEGRASLTGTQTAAPILFNTFNFLPLGRAWFSSPEAQLTEVNICRNDGYLSNGFCQTKRVKIPLGSHFSRMTPYHQRIYLDASQQWRVNSECESISKMQARDWFVLPPDQAYYYKQYHADYQPLPPWRPDCVADLGHQQEALSVVYPQEATQVYLPRELDGKLGEVIFRAVPTHPEALLYWHLDNQFLGTTQSFHQMAVQPAAGKHRLAVVDESGQRIERQFEVLVHEDKSQ